MEMTIVITLLALFAALIIPNLASEKSGREARQFFVKARNLMLEAKTRALSDGITRTIRLDDTGGRLVVERVSAGDGLDEEQTTTEERALDLPDGVTGSAFRVEKDDSTSAEWDIRFFADGKARAGGVSFTSNDRVISLTVDKEGLVKQIDGPLPDATDETWDAGGFEQRV
jgi:Tfp pilus assembly protein FimT